MFGGFGFGQGYFGQASAQGEVVLVVIQPHVLELDAGYTSRQDLQAAATDTYDVQAGYTSRSDLDGGVD